MKILVACGAGASSTFVALRVRRAAAARGIDLAVTATPLSALPGALAGADVLLLGAHLADRADELAVMARAAGVAVAVLPEAASANADGSAVLDLALDVAGAGQ
ncbi:PTS system, cellobiose-specific IIB component [Paramicrobacterium humi]|uniref:PTS system, cellobiose-specific IIB component n=1 Tax=Paramicrobacterium humi TaxID=640635 RepID=A0A1H4J0K4_9MICO|nr:hypothetical protein [Microbacterium humi]SEB39781.1 PTS system, cellobiose-specific IIB component [Microbacterium humi]